MNIDSIKEQGLIKWSDDSNIVSFWQGDQPQIAYDFQNKRAIDP